MTKIRQENAMLVDIQYIKPQRRKQQNDFLYIIWKDLDTMEKHLQIIEEPKMDIYFELPEYRSHDYPREYARYDELERRTVKYRDIIYEIAKDMGPEGITKLQNCFATNNYRGLREFYIYPYVYGADYDIRAWYRYKWLEYYNNERVKEITKGYMDIEVDIMEANGFPNPHVNPIDLVTFIDHQTKNSYTFALIGTTYKDKMDFDHLTKEAKEREIKKQKMYENREKQQSYYATHIEEVVKAAHEMFDESYPGFEYNFYFYRDERKMLCHLFQLINQLKLDFVEIWNIGFDIPYIINRLTALGLEPAEVMAHKDFPVKECWFKKDTINFQIKNKSDYFHLSSYTIFTDQMRNYAAIRKGGSELRSNKLTYIAKKEIGDEKLNYSEVGNIKTLSYNDYLLYILYNIKDVLLQYGIESVSDDLETYYITSYNNLTPYENEFKQTVKLRNKQYQSYAKQFLVPGENINAFMANYTESREDDDYDEEETKKDTGFEGALVGDPRLINPFGMKLYGKPTNNIFRYTIDFDMSRFYPSCIAAMNISPSCLIFKMIVQASEYKNRGGKIPYHGITDVQLLEDNDDSFDGDIAKEVMDNFQTGNYLSFGEKWLNLPSVNEIYDILKEEFGGVL